MSKRCNPARRPWREFATAQERADLAGLEANARLLDDRRAVLTVEINLIADRCQQRRLYAERKDARATVSTAAEQVPA